MYLLIILLLTSRACCFIWTVETFAVTFVKINMYSKSLVQFLILSYCVIYFCMHSLHEVHEMSA